jgi:hypothetical protein
MIDALSLATVALSLGAMWLIIFDHLALGWLLFVPAIGASILLQRL